MVNIQGLFPPIPTPFDSSGEVDPERLQSNLEFWNRQPLSGVVAGGSNGEFVFLTADERVEVVRTVRAHMASERVLIAGAAEESTRGSIDITRSMAEAGADVAMLVTPHYFKNRMTPAALEAHFEAVGDASPIPVLLYSVPANTGIDLPIASVVRLSEHRNIIGIKDSGGDVAKIGSMVAATPEDFSVLAGSAGFLLGALSVGAVGAVSALANIAAGPLADLMECFRLGELDRARELQLNLIDVNRAVTSRYGVAGLKAAMDRLGLYGGPVRGPLLPLTNAELQDLEASLENAGLRSGPH